VREGKSSSPSHRRDASDWLRPSAHRSTLASLRLSPTRENEIVEELSQHLEDRWEELVAGGAPLCGSSIARALHGGGDRHTKTTRERGVDQGGDSGRARTAGSVRHRQARGRLRSVTSQRKNPSGESYRDTSPVRAAPRRPWLPFCCPHTRSRCADRVTPAKPSLHAG
jgi:hypothetical protein